MSFSKGTARLLAGALREFSRNTGWMSEANCKDMDVNLFFPEKGNIPEFAREVCFACPVIEECAWYANESHSTDGMFGGMSPDQRAAWRKKNNIRLGMSRAEWEQDVYPV